MKAKSNPSFIHANWPAPAGVNAIATTRCAGLADKKIDFNLALHTTNDVEQVQNNRKLLISSLELPNAPIWLNQVHGCNVYSVNEIPTTPPKADAAYTTKLDMVCAVLTADCLPVLVCDTAGTIVAAIHAGWRGLQQQIIGATVAAMQTEPAKLMAWLGPAISAEAYEIDDAVREQFAGQAVDKAFHSSRPGHWRMDLYMIARSQLQRLGVQGVYGGDFCTYREHRFFSYRRDASSGRMATLIWLTDG